MIEKAWFKDWFNSPYYHLLYQNRNDQEALAFINRLIEYLNPSKNAMMLDMACGKGRHSKALADMGFEVTGVDLSEASIEHASFQQTEKLHFYQHDMRLPFRINYYDYVFNFFTSFGYFKTQREHSNAIKNIVQNLKKDGVFVIDYLNVQYISDRLVESTTTTKEGIEFLVTKWEDEKHFFKQIQISENGSHTLEENAYTERVAKFSLLDFEEMLSLQNTVITDVFGDYNLNSYDTIISPRMIIVAKKL